MLLQRPWGGRTNNIIILPHYLSVFKGVLVLQTCLLVHTHGSPYVVCAVLCHALSGGISLQAVNRNRVVLIQLPSITKQMRAIHTGWYQVWQTLVVNSSAMGQHAQP